MNQSPRTIVILLNWRQPELTARCIGSLATAGMAPNSIIAVDNDSGDGSATRLRERFPEMEVIENTANLGFGAGCNRGIKRALQQGAGYIWLLNNDTTVEAGTLPAMLKLFAADPALGAVGSIIYAMNEPGRVLAYGGGMLKPGRSYGVHCSGPEDLRSLDYLTGSSMLLRAEALQAVGLFDEKFFMYWEDADLCLRLREHGYKLGIAENSRVFHENGASSPDSALKSYRIFKSGLYFQFKHYSALTACRFLVSFFIDSFLRNLVCLRWKWCVQFVKLLFFAKK